MGAKVVIKAGGRTQTQQISTGHSVWAQHPNSVHFGLGGARSDSVSKIGVVWPDGEAEVFESVSVDDQGRLSLQRGAGS